ncbi:dienelactone hydrolase family protein [Humibacter sp. RRB41]|uniref:dienelactone hydrolase family protein n=1 Tax=Humibacter sp. RRB41 TaxID=2919946 RepID=UPI001FAA3F13|nr:alpha/beta hydrolase [Humibacter sp. RRB41]
MNQLQFSARTTLDGVLERDFAIGDVPGVLWSPPSFSPGTPLILMGHGGGLHKRAPGLVARARAAVVDDGYVVASIDAPGHGARPRSDEDQRWVDAMMDARKAGEPIGAIVAEFNTSLARRAVPEWQATIDRLQALPEITQDAPIGYTGMTLASTIGIALAAVEPRIRAAIFGGVLAYESLLEDARRITIPVEFLLPLDDAELPREDGLAVFDAFGSQEKTLHAFPGGHFRVPTERFDTRFFPRHLVPSVAGVVG